jgi:hypothetical protein
LSKATWRASDLIAQFAARWTAVVNNSAASLTGDIPVGPRPGVINPSFC